MATITIDVDLPPSVMFRSYQRYGQGHGPEVLAVAEGRDEAAGRKCLEKLTPKQRAGVRTYRADMGQAYHNACKRLLPQAKPVVDRFSMWPSCSTTPLTNSGKKSRVPTRPS